jgi:hypothetical protein
MTHALRTRSLSFALIAAALAACNGGSSSSGTSISLAVTDAASDDLSTFTIGLESVELISSTTGARIGLLQIPTAVDFAALTDLSRTLNITDVPADTYAGVDVTVTFDGYRVHANGNNVPATLVDANDPNTELAGPLTIPVVFHPARGLERQLRPSPTST